MKPLLGMLLIVVIFVIGIILYKTLLTGKKKYSCSEIGICVEDSNGIYTTKEECNKACGQLKYDCDANGVCVETPNGRYTSSTCNDACKAPAPQLQYDCDPSGKCVAIKGGKFLDSTCDNSCKPPPVIKYDCDVNGKCVPTNNGKYTTSNCDNACKPPPVTKYDCDASGKCVIKVNGKYTTSNCDNACKPPFAIKYDCDLYEACVPNVNGKYTTPNCDNVCKPPQKYDCDGTGKCVPTDNGRFLTSNCDNTCKPSILRYDCDAHGICRNTTNGKYSTSNCDNSCKPPPVIKYDCDASGKCVTTDNGRYLTSNCNNTCTPPQKYDCDSSGNCIPTNNGKYTTSNCDNECKPLQKYSCKAGKCVPDANGTLTSPTCNNMCKLTTYACSPKNGCIPMLSPPNPPGQYSSLADCKKSCNIIRYDCDVNGKCVETPNGKYTTSNCDNKCNANLPWTPIQPAIMKWDCDINTSNCTQSTSGKFATSIDCENVCHAHSPPHYSCSPTKGYCTVDISGIYTDSGGCDTACNLSAHTKDFKYLHDGDTFILVNRRVTDVAKKWQYLSQYSSSKWDQLAIGDTPLILRVHKYMKNASHIDNYIRSGDTVQIEALGNGYLWSASINTAQDKICGKADVVLAYNQPPTQQLSYFIINNGIPLGDIIITNPTNNNNAYDNIVYGDQTLFTLYSPTIKRYMGEEWCNAVGAIFMTLGVTPSPSPNSIWTWLARKWSS